MKKLLIALQFLTIFPVRVKSEIENKDFGASLLYFPLIGLLIGLLLALSNFLFSLPQPLKATLILLVSIVITGGIHLDGFADTCDGFYGNKPKEKILEIMRDSHIGVMGVIGITFLLLLKLSLIIALPDAILWKALIAMAVFARWSQALACSTSSYVRQEGKAKHFMEHARRRDVFIGGVFTLAAFLLLIQLKGLILFFLSLLLVSLFLSYMKKKIGGMTGDTIGAVNELSEVAILLLCMFCQIG
jgi:adenosylcobinamide-GDP ribazoletransferase